MNFGVARLIATREIRMALRDKAFRISTAISLAIVVALAVVPKLVDDGPESWEIGAVGGDARATADIVADAVEAETDTSVVELADAAAARAAVEAGDVDVAVLPDGTLLGDRDVDDQLEAALRQAWATAALSAELQDRGLSAGAVEQLVGAEPPGVQLLDPPNVERDRRVGFAAVAGIVLYLQLLGFGYWVAMSIVEEKTSQVIEILLAKVRPRTLLAGKAAGIGVLGLGQLVLYIAVGLGAFTLADRYPIPPGVWPLIPVVVIAYVLGYLTYAAVMAIAGALSARVEDLQTRTMPFTLVLTASYIGTIIAADDPSGTLARWLSFLPVSSPLVMPMRIAHGSVAVWEVALSVAIAVATTIALLRLADRVYRAGALRLRRTTKLRAALREAA